MRRLSPFSWIVVVAAGCAHDRGVEAPPTDFALVVPPVTDAAPPTIRPPQKSDYLEVPSAAPPTGSATYTSDELDGIDTEECRAFMVAIKRCIPESSYKEMIKNMKRQHQDATMRAAIADVCKRMIDSYSQNAFGNCGN